MKTKDNNITIDTSFHEKRNDFPHKIVEISKQRAAYICSNPECKVMTVAPSFEEESKVQYIGIVAHISAASIGGPRYDDNISSDTRMSISNAIFLCNNCATMIDKNKGRDYSEDKLKKWKEDHEEWVKSNLNKPFPSHEAHSITTSSENQSGGITASVVNVHGFDMNSIDEQKEHDKGIFIISDRIINEDNLNIITQTLLEDESITCEMQDLLIEFKSFFKKCSSSYLNQAIDESKNKLISSSEKLIIFLTNEFDKFPLRQQNENFKICMRPNLNCDRNGLLKPNEYEVHNKLYRNLSKIVTELSNNYKDYRKIIKSNLFI